VGWVGFTAMAGGLSSGIPTASLGQRRRRGRGALGPSPSELAPPRATRASSVPKHAWAKSPGPHPTPSGPSLYPGASHAPGPRPKPAGDGDNSCSTTFKSGGKECTAAQFRAQATPSPQGCSNGPFCIASAGWTAPPCLYIYRQAEAKDVSAPGAR
jgi:hypothetical protein